MSIIRFFMFLIISFLMTNTYAQIDEDVIILEDDYFQATEIIREIDDIKVIIFQGKPISDYSYCSASIKTKKGNQSIDSIMYSDIEPVGGDYGLLVYPELINNKLIITKYGDYDGVTIIINNQGNIFTTLGGFSYIDTTNNLLFSIYISDIAGLSIFNLNTDKEELELLDMENRPIVIYTHPHYGYLFLTENQDGETSQIWQIDIPHNKLKALNLTIEELNNYQLKPLINYEEIYIQCE